MIAQQYYEFLKGQYEQEYLKGNLTTLTLER
jgi:hypothetical protein